VVRGSAALLAGVLYFLVARALPGAPPELAAGAGALALAFCALAPLAGRDEPVGVAILGAGAVLLAVALNARDAGAGATPVEALFAAAAGLLFAYGFAVPAAVVALPLVVAGIDAAALLGGGADALPRGSGGGEVLTLDLPAWDGEGGVPRLSLLDATFLALFASWSVRYALRPRIAVPLMVVALVVAVVVSAAVERALPTLPFLAAAFLLPALDRLPHLLRTEG
jgi:hypothetical protein